MKKKTYLIILIILLILLFVSLGVLYIRKKEEENTLVYEINMQNKSTPIHNRKCKEFASYYDEIWRDLDVHI